MTNTPSPISLSGTREKPDFSYMYGETESEGKPLYGAALMASGSAEIELKPHLNGNAVAVLVDSGALGPEVDDLIIPKKSTGRPTEIA